MSDVPQIVDFFPENNRFVRVLKNGYKFFNLKQLFEPAKEHNFGVVAVNCRNEIIPEAVLEAAWQEKSPVILEIAESEAKYCNMPPQRLADLACGFIEKMIDKYGYTVPVALHMDHVQKDMTIIDKAVEAGFSSVEADLSKLPLEENIAKSLEVVKKLHPLGVSVELEDGEIGAADALADPEIDSKIDSYYTKAEDAIKLAANCQPEALAIFVGNGHGQYLKEPKIGFDRIKEVAEGIKEFGTSVVLHGGSGLSNEVFNKAIDYGARKVNYATSISDIMFKNFPTEFIAEMDAKAKELKTSRRKVLYLFEDKIKALDPAILAKAKQEIIDHLRALMRDGFRSAGKAGLYK